QGQHIMTNANILATAGGQYSIPLSALSSGVYILRLSFKGQTRVVKVSVL
ncbi:MAG: T9SS type A sorting domain-containing protein, partial [Prevotella sp.]|nr:T9SS type A sorting domain-containing protein [Prevotella sp.]